MKVTVGKKIAFAFGLCLAIIAAIGVATYKSTMNLLEATRRASHTQEVVVNLDRFLAQIISAETHVRGYLITGNERVLEPFEADRKAAAASLIAIRNLTLGDPEQQRRIAALESLFDARLALMRKDIGIRREQGFAAASQSLLSGRPIELTNRIRDAAAEMQATETASLQRSNQEATKGGEGTILIILFGKLLGGSLIALAGFLLYRSITRPLSAFQQFVTKVGEGDLTQRSTILTRDELGDLSSRLNGMVDGLKDLAGQTRTVAEHLSSATSQIMASLKLQASSTSEQAAAVQQTNVTMQELSQSAMQISERAKQVSAASQVTSKASTAGREAVQSTNRTMEAIRDQAEAVAQTVVTLSERTQAVGDIIATVNDLAEQAHLLALNAAIEAASAGEHGRTFFVVASEIKNMADRSKAATVQVRSILGEIQKGINSSVMLTEEAVKRAESGKNLAEVADRTIRELTEGVEQSVQAFQQIVAGTNQQQIAFEQVSLAIREIGQASEQTASSVHQLEGASAHLTSLGQQLRTTVERYRF